METVVNPELVASLASGDDAISASDEVATKLDLAKAYEENGRSRRGTRIAAGSDREGNAGPAGFCPYGPRARRLILSRNRMGAAFRQAKRPFLSVHAMFPIFAASGFRPRLLGMLVIAAVPERPCTGTWLHDGHDRRKRAGVG